MRLLLLPMDDGLALFDRRFGDTHVLDGDRAALLMAAGTDEYGWRRVVRELGLRDLADAWSSGLASDLMATKHLRATGGERTA